MECENCGDPATVHFTTISTIGQHEKAEQHYCNKCAWPFMKTTGEPLKLPVKKISADNTDWERMYRNEVEYHRQTSRDACRRAARILDLEKTITRVRVAINELDGAFNELEHDLGRRQREIFDEKTMSIIAQLKEAAQTPKEQ